MSILHKNPNFTIIDTLDWYDNFYKKNKKKTKLLIAVFIEIILRKK